MPGMITGLLHKFAGGGLIRLALLALLGAMTVLLMNGNAASGADGQTLVSNAAARHIGASHLNLGDHAQAFTSGSHASGYKLTEVRIVFVVNNESNTTDPSYTVAIHSDNGGSPGTALATLTNPAGPLSDGLQTFTAGEWVDLAPSTPYWVVVDSTGAGNRGVAIAITDSNGETFRAPGWSISNASRHRAMGGGAWQSSNYIQRIEIAGITIGSSSSQTIGGIQFGAKEGTQRQDALTGGSGPWYLTGRGGNDLLAGGPGGDTLGGDGGDDRLHGDCTLPNGDVYGVLALSDAQMELDPNCDSAATGGNDYLFGGPGNDRLWGGPGDDYLEGGGGNDVLRGQDGDDRLYGEHFGGNVGMDILHGGAGDDYLSGGPLADELYGGTHGALDYHDPNLNWYKNAGDWRLPGDTASYFWSHQAVTVSLADGTGAGGNAAGDTLSGIENLIGSWHNDTLTGNRGPNLLRGGRGADRLDGGDDGDQVVNAADYRDSAQGVAITISPNAADRSGSGRNHGPGSGGSAQGDTLRRIGTIYGSLHDDLLKGGKWPETFYGLTGDDTLYGGIQGADTLDGGEGEDTVDYSTYPSYADLVFNLSDRPFVRGDYTFPANAIDGTTSGSGFQPATLRSIENVTGTRWNDTIVGNGLVNRLDGGGGSDTVDYSASGRAVTVNLAGGTGAGGHARGDVLIRIENVTGSAHDDAITGSNSANILAGGAGADTLTGGAGNDVLIGSYGHDALTGGAGRDEFYFDAGFGSDTIADYALGSSKAASEKLYVCIGEQDNPPAHDGGVDAGNDLLITVTLDGSAIGTITLLGITRSHARFANLNVIVPADSGENCPHSDLLSNVNVVNGTDGPDMLTGTDGPDLMDGKGGDDTLDGLASDDSLMGGPGADALDGGPGTDTADYTGSDAGVTVSLDDGTATGGHAQGDTFVNIENLTGSAHDDTLTGDASGNIIRGGPGDDQLYGLGGDDELYGLAGNDLLEGGAGADALDGGGGMDTAGYTGAAAAVTVNLATPASNMGEAEGDTYTSIENVTGSAHDDTLYGDASDNILKGGAGADSMGGGDGIDTASYAGSDAGVNVNLSLVFQLTSSGHARGDGLDDIENLTGSSHDDTLDGDGNANVLNGGAGDDTLDGGGGIDTLNGGAGDDTLYGGGGDILNGGAGTDTVNYSNSAFAAATVNLADPSANTGQARGDTYTSIENVTGTSHDDTLTGDANANVLKGGGGSDKLNGGGGDDTLTGGGGSDEFYFYEGFGNDTITDYALGASKDASEKIYVCMGTHANLPTTSGADSGSNYVITVTFDGETAGTITLTGITSSSTNFNNLNVLLFPVNSDGTCNIGPPPGPLQVWFIEDTPLLVGTKVFMKVATNKGGGAICYIDDGIDTADKTNRINCPVGTLVSLDHPGGSFPVWADACFGASIDLGCIGGETARTSTHEVVVGGPTAPALAWASGGNGKLLVGWDASPKPQTGNINAYIVESRQRKADGTYPDWTETASVTTTEKAAGDREHTYTGLANGTWQVRVRARNDAGDTDAATHILGTTSEVRTVTLAAANTNLPGVPTFAAVTPGSGTLVVTWQPPDPDSGSLVYGYTVRHKVSGAADSTFVETTVNPRRVDLEGGSNPRRLEISGLTSGTDYVVEINALNVNGAGAWLTVGTTHRPN